MTHSLPAARGASPGLAGDTAQMWAEFSTRLRAFVAHRTPAGIEPDDVVQEVFLRVVRHLPSLRDADRIEAWLFQIARNALRDAMRARQRRDSRNVPLEVDGPAGADIQDERAAEAELAPCLTPMIARLAEPYRSAIELTSVQGLTQTEAAKRAGVSVSGMKSRVQRAREQLKQMLLRCCAVEVDRRGGVSDYQPRESACGGPTVNPPRASRCAHEARVASNAVLPRLLGSNGEERFAAIERGADMDMKDAIQPQTTISHATNSDTPARPARDTPHPCCGGPAPAGSDACCARDAEMKSGAGTGCGCGSRPAPAITKTGCCA